MELKYLLLWGCAVSTVVCRATTRSPADNPRASWNEYDLSTNYYQTVPDTGVVREYYFDVQNITAAPDGRERVVLAVNGQVPGPTIIADWGDTIRVHVTNSLQDNGTSIHFHGVRQQDSNQMDGSVSLTQCPVAPGESYTYEWRATAYGTSWYHSHFSLQLWDGVYGGIIINGPATADYDEDLGVLVLTDWGQESGNVDYLDQLVDPIVPQFDGGLINGTNVYDYGNGTVVGKRLNVDFQPGKRYRIRLINVSMHTLFKWSIDNHDLTVIGADFVAVQPVATNYVTINSGQRYDVVVEANQLASNYWMRAVPQGTCSNNTRVDDIKGIVHYSNTAIANPTTSKNIYTEDQLCVEFTMEGIELIPALALDVDISNALHVVKPIIPHGINPADAAQFINYHWRIGDRPFSANWSNPTLLEQTTTPDPTWTLSQNVLKLNEPDQWVVLVMQTYFNLTHPMHLHGHDFFVLAIGTGKYTPETPLNTTNPPRRDTLTVPQSPTETGYAVIAWQADNPGAWLLHCHTGFHSAEGFALQVLERPDDIPALVNETTLNDTCNSWNAWSAAHAYQQYKGVAGEYESGD